MSPEPIGSFEAIQSLELIGSFVAVGQLEPIESNGANAPFIGLTE